jgi:mRNA interferase HicA
MPTPELNRARILTRLRQEGWRIARQDGKHDVLKHPDKPEARIVLPRHRTLSPGVARQIGKVAGW